MKIVLILLLEAILLNAENKIPSSYLFFNPGISIPVFGDFGDSSYGFKKTYGLTAGYIKDIDELISYGFFISNYSNYENKKLNMKINIFSFTPVLFSWLGLVERKYYVYIGPGIYHWKREKNIDFDTVSSNEGGIRIGFGYIGYKRNIKNLLYGFNMEYNHMFNMNKKDINLGSVNTISLSFSLGYQK